MLKDIIVKKDKSFNDSRGSYWTVWEKNRYNLDFNHDKFSYSKKNVLRGLHGDYKSWKLVSCVYGEIFFVIVNNNKNHKDYLKYKTMYLNDKNKKQVLIPPGFANGHLCTSNECLFYYKWSYLGDYPDINDQFSIKWNDKRLDINWPIKAKPILSKRDK